MRRSGLATAIDELEDGLSAMAAPVRGPGGDVIAALSISGPTLRLTGQRVGELAPVLCDQAAVLTQRLETTKGKRAA